MRWEMELDEIEAVLEKIWDLHNKLSDAIHSISRTHFLNSIKSLRKSSDDFFLHRTSGKLNSESDDKTGFVFVKDFPAQLVDDESAIQEAKSLNAIRTALENLEDQLEFFHTIQTQQQVERDAAIARLEQSRIVLAMRLAEHQGNKYKVIEEAKAFVGNVCTAITHVTSPNSNSNDKNNPNIVFKFLISGFNFAKQFLKLDHMGGVMGNAALVAASMFALMHLHQVTCKNKFVYAHGDMDGTQIGKKNYRADGAGKGSSSSGQGTHLDVLLARG